MEQLVTQAGLRHRIEVDAGQSDIWDVFLPEAAYEAIIALGRDGSFDVVIVDEGQDFGVKHLEVFDALLRGGWQGGEFAVFFDPFQIPFRASASRVVTGYKKAAPVRCTLTVNCRNTEEVAFDRGAFRHLYQRRDPRQWPRSPVVVDEK